MDTYCKTGVFAFSSTDFRTQDNIAALISKVNSPNKLDIYLPPLFRG